MLYQVTGQAVATVSIAYDNETEIELYKRRGALIRERYRATQVGSTAHSSMMYSLILGVSLLQNAANNWREICCR